jgi:hypothetical protein
MTRPRSILLPDEDGHYRREALRLDRESHRTAPTGTHALDCIANEMAVEETRRRFFSRAAQGIGALALASLMPKGGRAADAAGGLPGLPHFAPKAKRCIYLHLVGAPPQMETFDYKPKMKELFDKDLPDSIRNGQRLTTMTSGQARFPIAPSMFQFAQHGKSGAWVSELLPYTARMVDDIAIIRSMHTEAINHEPAITFFQTGLMVAGRPCIGSWLSYGLGSMNQNLPAFVVLQAKHNHPKANVQAISARLWSAGFLSGQYAGVSLRSGGDPVLFINNPEGVPVEVRRRMLDSLSEMNRVQMDRLGDPETRTRIAQYEMAFRMQASVPELTDTSKEPESTWKMYGEDARNPASFAQSCLMARRLAERGVRFVQVYHRGWDVLLPVDGGRRHQRRHGARRDGRLQLQHHARSGPRTRFPCHDPAAVRHRSRAIHVSVPGSRHAADRRREGRPSEGVAGVDRSVAASIRLHGQSEVVGEMMR